LDEIMMSRAKESEQAKAAGSTLSRTRFPLVWPVIICFAIVCALCVLSVQRGAAVQNEQTISTPDGNRVLWANAARASNETWPEQTGSTLLSAPALNIPSLNGNTFYVSRASGRDSNNGSLDAPWRTIMHALERARAGDTILVRAGVYNENITFPRSGARDAPITLAGYPNERPVLDGTGLSSRDCFSVTTQSYLTIDGFIVRNYKVGGIAGFGFVQWDDAAVSGLTLRNLEMYNIGLPVKFAASSGSSLHSNITIENLSAHDYPAGGIDLGPGPVANVTIRNVRLEGVTSGNDTGSDGIAIENGSHILIEDTFVHGHQGDGVDCKADDVTLRRVEVRDHARNGFKIWKGNSLIENCWVSGSRTGLGALMLPGAGTYVVRNSVFLGSAGASGEMKSYTVELGGYGAAANAPPTLVTLVGNTFHTEVNPGILIYLSDNARLLPDSDYNTYFTPRQDTIFAGARNASGAAMESVTPASINGGAWSRFIRGEQHSKFNPRIPTKPQPVVSQSQPSATQPAAATPTAQRPRRVAAP
jgi:hypothetical protein